MRVTLKTKYMPEAEYELKFGRYSTGELSIQVMNLDGEQECTATVACEAYGLQKIDHDMQVYLKSYAENEGMLEAFVKALIIRPTTFEHKLNLVHVHECSLRPHIVDYITREGI